MTVHRLARADLLALATGPVTTELVDRLRSAEMSRHLMLLEAVRRRVLARGPRIRSPPDDIAGFLSAFAALARGPAAIRGMLARPQLGAWAVRSLRALEAGEAADLAYVTKLVDHATDQSAGDPSRTRLQVTVEGATLDVVLDHQDPYLDLYGPRAQEPSSEELETWRKRLTGAFELLVRHDRATAEALAAGVSTVVPLRSGADQRPVSASSGWAFGAIALSLPPEHESCADNLVHEFRHVLLGAVADHFPLLHSEGGTLVYAPWREDPRPLTSLLMGGHAYLGLLDFWGRQRAAGSAAVKFARWLDPTIAAVETLISSGTLTAQGLVLVEAMRRRLAGWHADGQVARASGMAEDAAADHLIRWRLRHLRPDDRALDELAETWPDGRQRIPIPTRVEANPILAVPPGVRSRLLELGCGGYGRRPELPPAAADQAFLAGRHEAAAAAYKERIAADDDADAWAGLALCRLRAGPPGPLSRQPEVVAGLHARLRARTGQSIDPDHLSSWLAWS